MDDFSGAGCYLQQPSDRDQRTDRYAFISNLEDAAIINIDGAEVRLALLEPGQGHGEALDSWALGRQGSENVAPGDTSTYRYHGGAVTVSVSYVVSQVCRPDDESCETIEVGAHVTVTAPSGSQTMNLKGGCGT